MNKVLDNYGYLGQIQVDRDRVEGGDSLAFNGHLIAVGGIQEISPGYVISYANFHNTPNLVRHPHSHGDRDYWAGYYNGVYDGVLSRDQLTGFLAAMATNKDKEPHLPTMVRSCIKQWAKRFFLFTNNTIVNNSEIQKLGYKPGALWFIKNLFKPTMGRKRPDLTLFDIWALYIRAGFKNNFVLTLLYPILLLGDSITLLNTVLMRFKLTEKKNDVISHFSKSYTARTVTPTFISKLNWLVLDKEDMLTRLEAYWTRRSQSFITSYYKTAIEELS